MVANFFLPPQENIFFQISFFVVCLPYHVRYLLVVFLVNIFSIATTNFFSSYIFNNKFFLTFVATNLFFQLFSRNYMRTLGERSWGGGGAGFSSYIVRPLAVLSRPPPTCNDRPPSRTLTERSSGVPARGCRTQ